MSNKGQRRRGRGSTARALQSLKEMHEPAQVIAQSTNRGLLATNVPWAPAPNTVIAYTGAQVPEPWTSAVCLVTRPGPSGLELLLTDVIARGLDLPGGHREQGEDVRGTAVRELAEETGLVLGLDVVSVLGFMHLHITGSVPADYAYPYPNSFTAVTAVRVPAGTEPGGTTVPEEISGHRWVPLAEVAQACGPRIWLPFLNAVQR